MTALYNEKVKQEKSSGTTSKKAPSKPILKSSNVSTMKQMGLEEYGEEDDYYNEDYYGQEEYVDDTNK